MRVWSAAIALVVLQSVASYGHARESATENLPEIRAQLLEAVHGSELSNEMHEQAETTIASLKADSKVKLEQHVRRSTREAIAAAAPADEAAPSEAASEALAENQGTDAPSGEAG